MSKCKCGVESDFTISGKCPICPEYVEIKSQRFAVYSPQVDDILPTTITSSKEESIKLFMSGYVFNTGRTFEEDMKRGYQCISITILFNKEIIKNVTDNK